MLIQLQSNKVVTAKELVKRNEISLITVYRDIKTLQDAGVPIGSGSGVGNSRTWEINGLGRCLFYFKNTTLSILQS
ncbi:HTH domain-containing protein [Mangrovimonas aestuarii]|uniref:HTH domain-containing protein n=1 Tax=Mangrovimonas aestuarii TaxID=3018443 RepID=UPI002379DD70|nr:HTH domain-containing protein [Mangrovimonas aestuarii]